MEFRVQYQVSATVEDAVLGIGIFRSDGIQCYGTNTRLEQYEGFSLNQGGEFRITFSNLALLPGEYFIDLAIESGQGIPVDYLKKAYRIETYSPISDVGVCRLNHQWLLGKDLL